jgi:hypothetical protein
MLKTKSHHAGKYQNSGQPNASSTAGVWANADGLVQVYVMYFDLSWDIFDGRWKLDVGA